MINTEIRNVLDVIEQSVKLAELDTTAEFKVHIEVNCPGEVRDRAESVFSELKLHLTKQRNSVLIYIAVDIRKFYILFDTGIIEKADMKILQKANYILMNRLRQNAVAEGIIEVIEFLGKELAKYFPYTPCNRNEIDDGVSTI